MKINLHFRFLLLCFLWHTNVSAQWAVDNKDKVAQIKNSILAIVVEEPDEDVLDDLKKKPDQQKAYRESIANYNASIKEIMQDWKYSKEIKFVDYNEMQNILDRKDKNYCIMTLLEVSNYKMGDFYSGTKATDAMRTPQAASYHISYFTKKYYKLEIYPANKVNTTLVAAHIPTTGMSYASLKFTVQYMKNQMDDCVNKGFTNHRDIKKEIDSNVALLRNKTLLLYNPVVSDRVQKRIDNNSIKEIYPFKVSVVSESKLDEIIKANDKNYAYVLIIPSGSEDHGVVLHEAVVVNAEDGRFLFWSGKTVAGAQGQFDEYHLKSLGNEFK